MKGAGGGKGSQQVLKEGFSIVFIFKFNNIILQWGIFPIVVENMILEQIKLSPDNTEIWNTWVGL